MRTDILRRELIRATKAAAPALTTCIWSPYAGPRPTLPFAEWRTIAQPTSQGTLSDDVETLELPRQADVRILSATAGQVYRVGYNYSSASALAGGASTVTTIQAALVAGVNADREPVTATAVGADIVRITGDADGGLWRCAAAEGLFAVSPTVGAAVDIVELQRAPLRLTASLRVYSIGLDSATESAVYAQAIMTALRSSRERESFAQSFISAVRISGAVSLSAIPADGTSHESLTSVDYALRLPHWAGTGVGTIENVLGSVAVGGQANPFTVEV